MKTNLKVRVVGLAMTIAAAAGCAHGTVPGGQRDLRGFARVGQDARALLAGPAHLVRATGEKPVRWFVAERTQGDDRDCAAARESAVLSESARAQLSVGSGHVLCASVASGATDVNWHRFGDQHSLWALR